MSEQRICHQVNLQHGFGGGEVYTCFFTRALIELGWRVRLYVSAENRQWPQRLPAGVEVVPLTGIEALEKALPAAPTTIFFHNPQPPEVLGPLKRHGHRLCVFAHMPLYGRNPALVAGFDHIVAVSQHVIDSLKAAGLNQFHAEPMLGVADLDRQQAGAGKIVAGRLYDWDRRKVRERVARRLAPLVTPFLPRPRFVRRPGLALGIVSRLTPIKQFPLLFSCLAPVLANEPDVNLEIFGDGAYASVRDLRASLRPLHGRYRFWGIRTTCARCMGSSTAC